MSTCIHALDIGVIVLTLRIETITLARFGTRCRPHQQAGPGPDTSPLISANRRTGDCSDGCSNHRVAQGGIFAAPPYLLRRKVAALQIAGAKIIDRFA